jgi:hypothetical protein
MSVIGLLHAGSAAERTLECISILPCASRFYYRRAGFNPVPLPGLPWSPEFMAAYEAAAQACPREIGASRTQLGTVDDAIVRYMKSQDFSALAVSTQGMRRAVLERFRFGECD